METHTLDHILTLISPFCFGIAVVAWIFGFVAQIRRMRIKDPALRVGPTRHFALAFVIFMSCIGVVMLLSSEVQSRGYDEVAARLAEPITAVDVDGRRVEFGAGLVDTLRKIDNESTRYHHSHPTKRLAFTFHAAGGDLPLILARDSSNPQEYWVFYPAYRTTTMNDIGKITTPLLDGQ